MSYDLVQILYNNVDQNKQLKHSVVFSYILQEELTCNQQYQSKVKQPLLYKLSKVEFDLDWQRVDAIVIETIKRWNDLIPLF